MYRAIADGKREFDGIVVIADSTRPFVPNGAVLQLLAEFNVPEIGMADMHGDVKILKLQDLLPYGREPIDNTIETDEETE